MLFKQKIKLDVVIHANSPSSLEAEAGKGMESRNSRENPILNNNRERKRKYYSLNYNREIT